MGVSRTRAVVLAGAGAVLMGAIAAAIGSWSSQVNLRSGLIPGASGVMVVGVGLIMLGSYRCNIGRPRWLLRWGCSLAFVGLGGAAAFLFGTGILAIVGSDVLSTGDTLVSAVGTLAAAVSTLLLLPVGLLAFGVAVLGDKARPIRMRGLPLVGTLAFMVGPVLIAVLPDSDERAVLIVWPVLLAAVWATYGLLLTTELARQSGPPKRRVVNGAGSGDGICAT